MDKKKVLLAAAALLFAFLAAFGVNVMMQGAAAPQVQAADANKINGPLIMVATRPLPVGTIINPEMIRFQPWPKELIESAYFLKENANVESLAGSVVRTAMTAGEPVTQGSLVKPGERGFLAAALGAGMRAVTVKVEADSGVAGFIFPGDRVDLVVSSALEVENGNDRRKFNVAETFIQNIRVLATDQRTDSKNAEGKDEVIAYNLVTLEATPKIAEKIAVAASVGRISLSLRSIADNQSELEKALATGDVKLPAGVDPKTERELLAQMATRPVDRGSTATTGGQVSRYQRSSLPPLGATPQQVATATQQVEQVLRAAAAKPATAQAGAPAEAYGPGVRIIRGSVTTETKQFVTAPLVPAPGGN